jgi:hypothetical protein
MRLFSIIIILFFLTSCVSSYPISDQLSEISGIENPVRSVYISINDSGDEPVLYIMKSDGVIFHKIFISGSKNVDWEDLSFDGDFLYVGDIGNNRNQRKDLMIYRIPWNNSWGNYYIDGKLNHNLPDTLRADPFSFNYPDQISFPPEESRMNFDSEALTYADGKILILSKDRSKPYQGLSKIYELDLSDKSSKTKLLQEIQLNGVSWLTGSVTGCDYLNNKLYVLTYKRLYIFERTKGQFKLLRKKNLGRLQQWEGISVESESEVRIVAEKSRLGKQKMKIIKL